MKKIENKGNLPAHLRAFATELSSRLTGGQETEFYEMSSISEFEKKAPEEGYEIVRPTVDMETNRGFLVGFAVSTPKRIITLVDYSQLKIYFVECSPAAINKWTKRISEDRIDQEQDMTFRRKQSQLSKKTKRKRGHRGQLRIQANGNRL